MKRFDTIQQFREYVPSCIICGKDMQVSFDCTLENVPQRQQRYSSGKENIHIQFKIREDKLFSDHKSYKMCIDPASNLILDGDDIANRIFSERTFVKKSCTTCHFKIQTECESKIIRKEKRVPHLTLISEELHFTLRGARDLRIIKDYRYPPNQDEGLAHISLNKRPLPFIPVDFNKFTGFEQLLKRIDTIILFH
jgi:hypothetical protein